MNFFDRIKAHYLRRSLAQRLRTNSVRRSSMPFERVKTVGIVYDRDSRTDESNILAFTKQLEREGKRVQLLVVTPDKVPNPEAATPEFTRGDRNWYGAPVGTTAVEFMNRDFDLLLNLCSVTDPAVEYLTAASRATFRVGTSTATDAPYELVIDPGANTETRQLIQQISRYLKIMNAPHGSTTP